MDLTARIKNKDVTSELELTASKSGGPGGQNVNKVNSKVTLRFNVFNSTTLTAHEKEVIAGKIASRINAEGELIVTAQHMRTQLQNKEAAIAKFNQLMEKAFAPRKIRRATKPGKGAVEKRLNAKKKHSEKKKLRQNL